MMTKLTVGSLFSGIGGIDLGLERTDFFKTVWFSEIDKYANQVLAKHWPGVPNLGNVKDINYETVQRPDVLVGGYPCQPFSNAGKRQGENDARHLWPECVRALRILRPRYALFENVRGHLSLGFSEVVADLAALGFNAEWQVIPAAAVGAPHKRDRLFIVAYPDDSGSGTPEREVEHKRTQDFQQRQHPLNGPGRLGAEMADPTSGRFQEREPGPETAHDFSQSGANLAHAESGTRRGTESHNLGEVLRQTSKPREQSRTSGTVGHWWQIEPDVGRVAYGVPARVDRLRALGNAVVPQVAEYVGYLIANHANA